MGRGVVRALQKPCPLPALRRRRRKPAPCLRCAPMCPMSPRAAGEGSLGGVCTLRRSWGVATAVALMQGGGGGGRRWGGALRSGTVEAVRVATLILREHPKRHIID